MFPYFEFHLKFQLDFQSLGHPQILAYQNSPSLF